jgi:hypothetical protein
MKRAKGTSKPKEPVRENAASRGGVEGEGSYSATHRYAEGLAKSLAKGDSERLAKAAEQALEGPEGPDLLEAAEAAKQGHVAKQKRRGERAA